MPQDLPPAGGYGPVQYKVCHSHAQWHPRPPRAFRRAFESRPLTPSSPRSATSPSAASALPTTWAPWSSSWPTAGTGWARASARRSACDLETNPCPLDRSFFEERNHVVADCRDGLVSSRARSCGRASTSSPCSRPRRTATTCAASWPTRSARRSCWAR